MSENQFKFSDEQRRTVLQTALMVQAAEASLPVEQRRGLSEIVESVGFAMSPGSLASTGIYNVEKKFENVAEWKHVTGTLIHIDRETSSGRAIIITQTEPNEHNHHTGQELTRTGPTSWDATAKELAYRLQAHIGDTVSLRVAIERMPNGRKSRVAHDAVFRGPNRDLFDQNGNFIPQQVRWDVLGGGGKPFNTANLATFAAAQQQQQ